MRQRLTRAFGDQAETTKKVIRDIRSKAIKSTSTSIKDMDLRRRADAETQQLYTTMVKNIDELVDRKQKEIAL
jgi:ribosome recycling factor